MFAHCTKNGVVRLSSKQCVKNKLLVDEQDFSSAFKTLNAQRVDKQAQKAHWSQLPWSTKHNFLLPKDA